MRWVSCLFLPFGTFTNTAAFEQSNVGIFELTEGFASQSIYCICELGLDMAKVNPNRGAIALGHPIGATGTRQVATLLAKLQRHDSEMGIVSMCAR